MSQYVLKPLSENLFRTGICKSVEAAEKDIFALSCVARFIIYYLIIISSSVSDRINCGWQSLVLMFPTVNE